MNQTRDIVDLCAQDLKAHVEAAVQGTDKAFYVYNTDMLMSLTRELTPPLGAVLYQGMRPKEPVKPGAGSSGVTITFMVMIAYGNKDMEANGAEDKCEVTALLRDIRDRVKNTQSPTGHKWAFNGEAPADLGLECLCYMQSWSVSGAIV